MAKFCLWGWREGYVQVGSPEDQLKQSLWRMSANMRALSLAFSNAMYPTLLALSKSITQFSEQMHKIQEVQRSASQRETKLLLSKLSTSVAALGQGRTGSSIYKSSRSGRGQAAVPPPQPPRWEGGSR